jgi:type IV pilus assembly protein PilX
MIATQGRLRDAPGRRRHARRREDGVIMIIALIVLIAMTLAGVSMVRSIDAGTLVAGNIGFHQAALATADSGVEAARKWLIDNRSLLDADNRAAGYYATRQDNLDITGNRTAAGADGVDWDGSDPSRAVKAFHAGDLDSSGNDVYYLIHRLCAVAGNINAPGQSCATTSQLSGGSTMNAANYPEHALKDKSQIFYRITARANGPKNTVSYVQAVILI